MEQVILDHLYFDSRNISRSGDHLYDELSTDWCGLVRLGFQKPNRLNSLFGKYPNFVFVRDGIKTNNSKYRSKLILDEYDGEVIQKELSTYVNNLSTGITALYQIGKNEPREIILRGCLGMMKKQIFYSNFKKRTITYNNYGNIIDTKII